MHERDRAHGRDVVVLEVDRHDLRLRALRGPIRRAVDANDAGTGFEVALGAGRSNDDVPPRRLAEREHPNLFEEERDVHDLVPPRYAKLYLRCQHGSSMSGGGDGRPERSR